MRLLFVNPPSPDKYIYIRDINRSGRRSIEGTIWPQVSLAMLAAVFPEDECKIIDCIAEGITYKQLYEQMREFKPDWVIFNPITSTITHDMIVAHYGKALGAKTVAISPHTKVLKEESLGRYKSLDFIIDASDSEPEYNLAELIRGYAKIGRRFENLPPARQDLLPIHRYSLPFIGKGYTFVVASRGCPWKCIYCRQTVMYESRIRYRPIETVVEEIRKYHLTNIAFHADTFTTSKPWVYKLCDELDKLPFKVRWVCNSRVDTVDLSLLQRMKKSGCWMICYGIESGDNKVLAMNKKGATVEQARQAVRWAKEAGIKVWGYFMLGLYGDTRETMERTVQLSLQEPFEIVNYSISAPYPGTEWGNIAEERGWLVDKRWESYDQNYSAQVSQPGCDVHLVRQFQRMAYIRWYFSWRGFLFLAKCLRPRYISYLFKVIKNFLT